MKNFELIHFASAQELASAVAGAWLDQIETAGRAGKKQGVALSGGRITQVFFAATVEQARKRSVSFANVDFFWADERCVPPVHPESNFKMANELLLIPLKIPENQIHRIRGEDPPAAGASKAEADIVRYAAPAQPLLNPATRTGSTSSLPGLNGFSPMLDLIFLGMGEDGHVASLFPNAGPEIRNAAAPFLVVENSPKPPPVRISLSYKMIFEAKEVWVLVSGAGKESALRKSLAPDGRTPLADVIRGRPATKIFSDIKGF